MAGCPVHGEGYVHLHFLFSKLMCYFTITMADCPHDPGPTMMGQEP